MLDRSDLPPDPVIEAYKKDVDRTLIRRNLRLTVEERFRQLMDMQRFAEELRAAGRPMTREAWGSRLEGLEPWGSRLEAWALAEAASTASAPRRRGLSVSPP